MLLYVLFFKLKNKPLLFFIFNSNYRYGNKIEDKHKNVIVEINNKKNYLFKLRRRQDNNWRFGIHPPESFWIRTLIGIWKQTRQTINHLHSRGIYIYKDPKYLYVEVLALVQKMQDLTQLHTSCKQEKKKHTPCIRPCDVCRYQRKNSHNWTCFIVGIWINN